MLAPIIDVKNIRSCYILCSITLTAKSSKKNERRQVNKKFHKFERVYRDCIKRTRDKTRIHCIPHDAPGT